MKRQDTMCLTVPYKSLNHGKAEKNFDHFLSQLKCAANVILAFGFVFKIKESTTKQNLVGSIETCLHERRSEEAKGFCQQN